MDNIAINIISDKLTQLKSQASEIEMTAETKGRISGMAAEEYRHILDKIDLLQGILDKIVKQEDELTEQYCKDILGE